MKPLEAYRVGAAVYRDWLGEGLKPVPAELSEVRARTCTHGYGGEPCPHNWKGPWWTRISEAVALTVRNWQRARYELGVSTTQDEALHTCNVCWCPLREKVHTPIEHIAKNTPDEIWAQLPDFCWLRKETGR